MAGIHGSHSRSGSNLSYNQGYRTDRYNSDSNQGPVMEATHIIELLHRQIAYLSGGRDRRGGPIITFPSHNIGEEFTPKDIIDCVTYLASIPSEESSSKGLTVVIDNRTGFWKNLKYLLKTLWDGLGPQKIGIVYVLQASKQGRLSSFRKDKYEVPIEPQMVTIQKLHQYISPSQLTPDFGGTLRYSHDAWLNNRMEYERFLREAKSVSMHLDSQMSQINELWKQEANLSPNDLFRQREYLRENVLQMPESIIRQGRDLYRKFQVDAESGFAQSNIQLNDNNYTLDQVIAMTSIKRKVEHLELKLDKITELWQDKERTVGQTMQLSELELAMKTVVEWILGPAEKLLISQTDIGTNYTEADELRKQHEQLELKCTDTYGTYAELRHKGEELLQEGHDKAIDLEAQRDYMDTVCRSYAARLEKRRHLIITSVRYHRLLQELSGYLDDIWLILDTDIVANDVPTAEKALQELTSKCETINIASEQTFIESHNLLDQLSLPIKNAFGQDITPNNQLVVDHVEQSTEQLKQRKAKCDEKSEVRKLKVQQIFQLRTCERDAQQATHWILELSKHTNQIAAQASQDPVNAETERKKLESTAKSTYEYGKQLLQASLVLRRSLRYDLIPNKEMAQRLNEAWQKFTQGIGETAARLNSAALFDQRADEVLNSINQVTVVISQVLNHEVSLEELIVNYTGLRDRTIDEYNATVRMGQELLQRLAIPVMSHDGPESRADDRAMTDTVQNKMDLLQSRIQKLDKSWQEVTQGLYLGPRGEIIGPDGRIYQQQPQTQASNLPPRSRPVRRTRSGRIVGESPLVVSQASIHLSAPPKRDLGQHQTHQGQMDPWKDMEQQLKQLRTQI